MIRNLFYLLSCTFLVAACEISEESKDKGNTVLNEVKIGDEVCFNHSLIVLDSMTYSAVINSEFIHHFAFSHEKRLPGYHGFYMIGKTNYLEIFQPNSFEEEYLEQGTIWICFASLKANYLKTLNKERLDFITLASDDYFNELAMIVDDSINPISTREIRKKQYESWTKKVFHDSITFLPVDYNSPQESDSASNYLMNDVYGIGLSLNPFDSSKVIKYLKEIGYDSYSEYNGNKRVSNNDQFIELHVSKDINSPTINRYYIHLNKAVEPSTEVIGNSRIELNGKSAIWVFEW